MPSLTFAPLPPGPLPLFLGEPRDDISAQGQLCCDHAAKTVFFRPADPFESHRPLTIATRHRYSTWEVDAMMPRRQLLGLYGEVRPLLEKLDENLTVRLTEEGWARTATPEAQALEWCIDEALNVPVDVVPAWVPAMPALPATWRRSHIFFTNDKVDLSAGIIAFRRALEKSGELSTPATDGKLVVTEGASRVAAAQHLQRSWGGGKTAGVLKWLDFERRREREGLTPKERADAARWRALMTGEAPNVREVLRKELAAFNRAVHKPDLLNYSALNRRDQGMF